MDSPTGFAQCGNESDKERMMDYTKFRNFFLLLPDSALLFDYWLDSTCSKFRGCDIGCTVQMSNKQGVTKGSMRTGEAAIHLVAGMLAGAVSRTVRAQHITHMLLWSHVPLSNMTHY
eukprot:9474658-Pyramimonas_sp.AAC.1